MSNLALVFALIGIVGIGAQWIAWRTGLPAIALMLTAGIVVGPVLGLIDPEQDFGALLEPMISVAVALILFDGGLNLNVRELRRTEGALFRLVAPVRLNVVCFTLANGDAAALQRLHKALHEDGAAYLSPSVLDGQPMLRAALCNWRTTDADVEQTYAALKRLATAAVHPSP